MRKIVEPLLLTVWVLVFLLFAVGITWNGWQFVSHGVETMGWPTVKGVVTETRVTREPARRKRAERCGVIVTYRYSFEGQTYLGRAGLGDLPESPPPEECSASAFYAQRYPVGRPVTVAVNPRAPTGTTLAPGLQWLDLYPLGIALCLDVLVFAILQTMWRSGRRAAPQGK